MISDQIFMILFDFDSDLSDFHDLGQEILI